MSNEEQTNQAAQDAKRPSMSDLLAWIDSELEYHDMVMNSIDLECDDPEVEAHQNHNICHMRLTQLKDALHDAYRYRWLRERDLETIDNGGVFAGQTPENLILNGSDLDIAIDTAMTG